MPSFRSKNLMIHIVPDDEGAAGEEQAFRCLGQTVACTAPNSLCRLGTVGCGLTNCQFDTIGCTLTNCRIGTVGCRLATIRCDFITKCGRLTVGCAITNCEFDTIGCTPTNCAFQSRLGGEVTGAACALSELADVTKQLDDLRPSELAALRDQLKALSEQVHAKVESLRAAERPQTVADAEALEKQLLGALDELRAHKKSLEKK